MLDGGRSGKLHRSPDLNILPGFWVLQGCKFLRLMPGRPPRVFHQGLQQTSHTPQQYSGLVLRRSTTARRKSCCLRAFKALKHPITGRFNLVAYGWQEDFSLVALDHHRTKIFQFTGFQGFETPENWKIGIWRPIAGRPPRAQGLPSGPPANLSYLSKIFWLTYSLATSENLEEDFCLVAYAACHHTQHRAKIFRFTGFPGRETPENWKILVLRRSTTTARKSSSLRHPKTGRF